MINLKQAADCTSSFDIHYQTAALGLQQEHTNQFLGLVVASHTTLISVAITHRETL